MVEHVGAAVISAFVTLAHDLEMRVFAEGTEVPDQIGQRIALECGHGKRHLVLRAARTRETPTLIRIDRSFRLPEVRGSLDSS